MKINRDYKPKSFRFKDNLNINYEPYYQINDGFYSFSDKLVHSRFMYHFGITCGAERKIIDNKVCIYYNGLPINQDQIDFLKVRGDVLYHNVKGLPYARQCNCQHKRT